MFYMNLQNCYFPDKVHKVSQYFVLCCFKFIFIYLFIYFVTYAAVFLLLMCPFMYNLCNIYI